VHIAASDTMRDTGSDTESAATSTIPSTADHKAAQKSPEKTLTVGPYIVAVGASAGGLEALRSYVDGLQPDGCFTYVIAQHLSPRHKSLLTSILSDATRLKVIEASDGVLLQPDTIYVVPPNKDAFVAAGNVLRVVPLTQIRPPHPSVDRLFTSLAEQKGKLGTGIILSGTGSDGTIGSEALSKAGGVVLAQDDVTAKYSGMPHSVVSAGFADAVCAPQEMHNRLRDMLDLNRGDQPIDPYDVGDLGDEMISRFTTLIAEHGDMDLSHYKRTTVERRIKACMREHCLEEPEDYLSLLARDNGAVLDLQNSILISVTSFFRDTDYWEKLRIHITDYLAKQRDETGFRVWVPGCATGEEAYSIAILLTEILGHDIARHEIKIFATDMDAAAIDTARAGSYPAETISELPKHLQETYFLDRGAQVQVIGKIRDMCVFARHDVTVSPPFMYIDMVSCRNLLIYFDEDLQTQMFEIFHTSLKRGGLLYLGKSEANSRGSQYFYELDRKASIYAARDVDKPRLKYLGISKLSPSRQTLRRPEPNSEKPTDLLNRMVLERQEKVSLLLDEGLMLIASSGPVNDFLQVASGATSNHICALMPEEMVGRARAIMYRAFGGEDSMETRLRDVKGWPHDVRLEATPVHSRSGEKRLLVELSTVTNLLRNSNDPIQMATTAEERLQIVELEQDLALTQEHLQTVVEELEIANEELQTMNEELNSSNEELHASNEQLATSNEELQSTNEELVTVNEDLERKSSALAEGNIELNAILESFGAPVMLLDRRRKLVRANHSALNIMRGGEANMGRFFDEIDFDEELPDVSSMMMRARKTGEQPFDIIQASDARYWTLRVSYVTDSSIDSASYLLVFTDQTELMTAQDHLRNKQRQLQDANARQTAIINGLAAHVALIDQEGYIVQVNDLWRNFARMNGYSGVDFGVGRNYLDLCRNSSGECSDEADDVASGLEKVLRGDAEVFSVEYPCHAPNSQRWFECIIRATPLNGRRGAAVMHVNVTEKKLTEMAMRNALTGSDGAADLPASNGSTGKA